MDRREDSGDWSAIRPGEERITPPAPGDAGLVFIGHLETPWAVRDDAPRNPMGSEAVCTVHVDPPFRRALKDVESCSHIILLYWLDKARRDLVIQAPRFTGHPRGTFALRSPNRPNPIGLAVADLIAVDAEAGRLTVRHVDAVNGTPLLDIKPYFASVDAKPDAAVGWFEPEDTR